MIVGVLGLGSIGKRHADNIRAMGHRVIGYDPIADQSTQRNFAITMADAVVVASPTQQHLSDIFDVQDKCIFVEKPIAETADQCAWLRKRIIADAIFIGYNLRFRACIQTAKQFLDAVMGEPALGPPLWAHFACGQFNDKPSYRRDGVILNWSHEIDLALHLLGPATYLFSATRLVEGKDDLATIVLRHDNGCISTIHLDYVTRPEVRHFRIVCHDGSLFGDTVNNTITVKRPRGQTTLSWEENYDQDYISEMRAFLHYAHTGIKQRGCYGNEALDVLDICLRARKDAGLTI